MQKLISYGAYERNIFNVICPVNVLFMAYDIFPVLVHDLLLDGEVEENFNHNDIPLA